jgi:hypothetical protein
MTRTKLGLLGLCAMVFGLMAFSATAAQAEPEAKWLLAEKAPGTGLLNFLEAEIELKKDGTAEYPYVLHSETIKVKFLFLCKDLKIAAGAGGNPKLIVQGGISSGRVLFSGCLTDLNGAKSEACTPKDATEGVEGTILTKPIHSLLVLHILADGTKPDILKLLPDEGETFAVVELGAACPIGTKIPVIGELALKDCEGLALVHLVEHLVEPFEPLTKLWTISKTAEHVATLLGSAWGFLKGAHLGIKFSGDPA